MFVNLFYVLVVSVGFIFSICMVNRIELCEFIHERLDCRITVYSGVSLSAESTRALHYSFAIKAPLN